MTPTTLAATASLAEALVESDLMRRYSEYADRVPTMKPTPLDELADVWANHLLAALLALPPDRRAALAAELLDVETLAVGLGMCTRPVCYRGGHEYHLSVAAAILAALRSPQ